MGWLITRPPRLSSFTPMDEAAPTLQVLIANGRDDRLDLISDTVVALGHEVIARTTTSRTSARSAGACTPTWRSSASASTESTRWR